MTVDEQAKPAQVGVAKLQGLWLEPRRVRPVAASYQAMETEWEREPAGTPFSVSSSDAALLNIRVGVEVKARAWW